MVLCSFPNADEARQIGTLLVRKQLVACFNMISGVESLYRWEGKLESSQETLAIMKTSSSAWQELEKTLQELHPYDCPAIIMLHPEEVSEAYREWVVKSCSASL